MTCSGFIKSCVVGMMLAATAVWAATPATITVNSAGRDLNDAMVAAVRAAVKKSIRSERLTKAVLEEEIVPAYSQLVGQYKVTDGSEGGGSVGISATVDLAPVQSLLAFTPESLGLDPSSAKAVVVVRGAKVSILEQMKAEGYYQSLEKLLRERMGRRGFEMVREPEASDETRAVGDDVASPEVIRFYTQRAEAEVGLGISVGPDEDTEKGGWEMRGTLIQLKGGRILGRFSAPVALPRQRKETAQQEWSRALLDGANQVLLALFSRGGALAAPAQKVDESLVVRLVNPSGPVMLEKFRGFLVKLPEVDGVVERSAKGGAANFTVRTRLQIRQLESKLKSQSWDEFDLEVARGDAAEVGAAGLVLVRLTAKAVDNGGVSQ